MPRSIIDKLTEMHRYESMLLEDILYEATREEYEQRNKEFQVGDVILTKYYSTSSHRNVDPHRIMIIMNKEDSRGFTQYEGLPLKSIRTPDKSNRNKEGGYPNSLYIRDYSTILQKGEHVPYPSKEVFIDVADLARFRSYEISLQGSSYAGHVTDEFYRFVMDARNTYKSGGDNSNTYWE